jgi:hypothetical protein
MRRLLSLGVDGMISDRPDLLLKAVDSGPVPGRGGSPAP